MAATYENVLVESPAAAIRVVTVNRPAALNALTPATLEELRLAFEEVAKGAREDAKKDAGKEPNQDLPGAPRCVIVKGAGERAFVAGADIKSLRDLPPREARAVSELGHRLTAVMESLPVPIIAAVRGFALGGGCELALGCDFIYAADDAKFGFPELKIGVIPGFGGTQRLARRIGLPRAKELIFTGRQITADEAFRLGFVNRVCPAATLMATVLETAEAIAQQAPLAIADAKRALHASQDLALADGLALESQLFGGLFDTEDQDEGMRAFVEKRAARFIGR